MTNAIFVCRKEGTFPFGVGIIDVVMESVISREGGRRYPFRVFGLEAVACESDR